MAAREACFSSTHDVSRFLIRSRASGSFSTRHHRSRSLDTIANHGESCMPPKALIDLAGVDLEHVVYTEDQISAPLIPHRHELALLSRIIKMAFEKEFSL